MKNNSNNNKKKKSIETLEVMKMLQTIHLDKMDTRKKYLHGKIFPDISKSVIR